MHDPSGNVVALLDENQNITDTFSYWPYGEEKSRTGTTPTPFRFGGAHGYYRDSASRTYVRARHLDTQKGRWLTPDPIGFGAGDINLYRYTKNRPVTLVDRTGLFGEGHGNPSCPWVPQLACWMCWYRKLMGAGWEAGDACKKAKQNCSVYGAVNDGIDCDNPPGVPGSPPRPPQPPGGIIPIIGAIPGYPYGNICSPEGNCMAACMKVAGQIPGNMSAWLAEKTCDHLCYKITTAGCDRLLEWCGTYENEYYNKNLCIAF